MKHPALSPRFLATLRAAVAHAPLPLVDQMIAQFGKDPFIILISCLLSLRARDVVTIHVCRDLFTRIRTPQELIAIDRGELETIIYKTGYYKTKAATLQTVARHLIAHHHGLVPRTHEALLALPGVGIKTAHLVLGLAFDIPAICVDTHVHRISNVWGLVKTQTAEETEEALRAVLPQSLWIEWNRLLVMLGQTICTPPTPRCSACPLTTLCPKIGVLKSR